jgi:putative flippase GtrA
MMRDGSGLLAQTPLTTFDSALLGRNLALALAVLVVLLWNFGINRIWTYSDVD